MRIDDYIPGNDEDNMLGALKDYQTRQQEYTYKATNQDLFGAISDRAARIGRIAKLAPHLEPGVVMALAGANANDSMIAKVGLAAINVEKEKAEKELAEKRQGARNWLWGKTKTALRWGNATAQIPFDIANTLGTSIVRPTGKEGVGEQFEYDLRNPFRKGWWASTEFGTLQMEDEKAGNGIMGLGGEARQNRERRLQDFAGKIPLTKEAGASEDTQFEASPDQIRAVALQILAQKEISYEEAYDEANRLIRSQAFMASTVSNLSPLTTGKLGELLPISFGGVGAGQRDVGFQFSDVGSTEYAITSAIITLAMAATLPEPVSAAFKSVKGIRAYAQYGKYVDDLGNIVGDVATISDNLAAEARFMADTDAMVVLANDFDIASISLADEAVETLTPQPGVWWHGSSKGPIEGNRFFDIDDPRYPTLEGNLVGPAFYTTESPIIGAGAYPRRLGATRALTEEEKALALEATGGRWDLGVQMGMPEEVLSDPISGINTPPAAAYRLIEKEGSNPKFLDADLGLVDQMSREEITSLADFFFNVPVEADDVFRTLIPEGGTWRDVPTQRVDGQIVFLSYDDFVKNIEMIGFLSGSRWNNRLPQFVRNGKTPLEINSFLKQMGFDGWTHLGGNIVGSGERHRVRALFDPMKHLDIADPITGQRLPINESVTKMRESGQLAERAGEIRTQLDEIKMMKEAGLSPDYKTVDSATANTFFTQSRAGREAVQQIWKVVEKFDNASGMPLRTNKEVWYSLWKMFKGRIPLQDIDDILRATSENELIGILNTKVGFTPGLANVNNFDFGLSKTFNSLKEASRIDVLLEKADDFFGPILSRTPKSKHLHIFGSEREKLQALEDLDAFLETGVRGGVNKPLLPNETLKQRQAIVADFAEAMRVGDRNAMFQAAQQLGDAVRTRVILETGDAFQAQQASDLWNIAFDKATGKGFFSMGAEGLRTDNGYAALLNEAGEMELVGMVHGGPGLLSELLQSPLELPDIQQLRRTTSMLGIFTGKQGLQRVIKKSELRTNALKKFGVDLDAKDLEKIGELRVPLRVAEFFMHKVWKNAKKFSLAYGIRNTMEAQARLAFSDLDSIYTHPIDHLLVAAHQKLPDDILLGEEFNPLGVTNLGKLHEEAGEGYRTMLGNAYYASDQAIDMVESQFRNSRFVVYSKDVPVDWAEAGGYELRQLFNDPVARRFAAGQTLDEAMEWLYSGSDEAKKALQQIEDVMRNGETFYGAYGIAENISITPTRSNVRLRVQTQQLDRLNLKTGGDPVLMEVASKGTIRGENAFTPRGNPTAPLVEYLVENIDSTSLPTFYKARGKNTALAKAELGWFDNLTKQFFDGLIGRAHNVLDRSPLWRTEYTREVNRLAPLLSREAADEMIEIIERRVAYYNDLAKAKKLPREFTLQDYVGRNVDPDELMESLRKANGWMSRDELHVLANGLTLDRIENLLFDATKRNSITDAARIVSPFGAAFAEVLGTWMKLTAKNPDKIVNLTRKFEILANEDQPDVLRNKGLIHKDPVTGQFMYSLPMSRQVASLFNNLVGADTGTDYGLYAPVKGLNMAFNFTPGFSPVVGYPLGKLLYDSPKLRDFATFFLPYGQPKSPLDVSEYAPGWLSKIINGFVGNPRSAGVYADTLADVVRVEASTGKWDLSNPEERTEFYRDAEAKAKVLTIMRGVGQLVGPSAPVIDSKIKTESGNVFAGILTSEFHKLQSEDYDTAVDRFLTMFGDETFVFMAGKTREVMSGVEANKEFAKWELENAELFDTSYADIAGFFGPKGSTFDWAAWNYQINKGKRERILAIPTQLEIAEQIVGLNKYRAIVDAAGPNPNAKVQQFVTMAKTQLEKEYPGMVTQSQVDVTKFQNRLKMMQTAVDDPRLKDNPTAQALGQYLDLRNVYTTFAKSNNIGWASPDSAGLRADLRYRAQWIIKETPEFARIFDRILSYELEK